MSSNVLAIFKNVIPLVGFSPVLVGFSIGSLITQVFSPTKGKSSKEEVKDLEKEKELLAPEIFALAVQKSRIHSAFEELERTLEEKRQNDLSEINEELESVKMEKQSTIEQEVIVEKLNKMSLLDQELRNERERRFNDLEVEVSHHKEKALNEVLQWSEEEVKRLRKRYDKEYRLQLTSAHDELIEKVLEDFKHIHQFFESFSKQKKALAEKDILSFFETKEKGIKELLKQRPFSL